MIPWVIGAKYVDEYKVHLEFNDGTSGEVDLAAELDGEIFEPLKDRSYFQAFQLVGHTLAWENGADIAPEYLYALLAEKVGVAL